MGDSVRRAQGGRERGPGWARPESRLALLLARLPGILGALLDHLAGGFDVLARAAHRVAGAEGEGIEANHRIHGDEPEHFSIEHAISSAPTVSGAFRNMGWRTPDSA